MSFYEYTKNGILRERYEEDYQKGVVLCGDSGISIAVSGKDQLYTLKQRDSHWANGQKVFFVPGTRKWQGKYWAKRVESRIPCPAYYYPYSMKTLHPNKKALCKAFFITASENLMVNPVSDARDSEEIVIFWSDNECLEIFRVDAFCVSSPLTFEKGSGTKISIEDVLNELNCGTMMPFRNCRRAVWLVRSILPH